MSKKKPVEEVKKVEVGSGEANKVDDSERIEWMKKKYASDAGESQHREHKMALEGLVSDLSKVQGALKILADVEKDIKGRAEKHPKK